MTFVAYFNTFNVDISFDNDSIKKCGYVEPNLLNVPTTSVISFGNTNSNEKIIFNSPGGEFIASATAHVNEGYELSG